MLLNLNQAFEKYGVDRRQVLIAINAGQIPAVDCVNKFMVEEDVIKQAIQQGLLITVAEKAKLRGKSFPKVIIGDDERVKRNARAAKRRAQSKGR